MRDTSDTFANDRSKSDVFDKRYYVMNKQSLCFVGQWPYQSPRERYARTIVLTLLTFTLLIPQILKLMNSSDDINIFIECLSPLITNVGFTIKMINLVYNNKKVKRLLDEIRDNWDQIRPDSPELKILREYGERGRLCTLVYTILINSVVMAWIAVPMISVVMDIVSPLNETRPHLFLFQTDYKVDPDEYFYVIFVHGSIVCIMGIQMFVSNDTLYMVLSQHVCGMIQVLRYHLEYIKDERPIESVKLNDRDQVHYRSIVACIKRHNYIIAYIRLIESTCEWYLILVVALNVLVMSCTGARTVAKGTAMQDVMRFAFFTLAQLVHLFCSTLPGHWIMEASALIEISAYNCQWYVMSPRSKRLLVLLIRRCKMPCTLTVGKIYVMSMKNFCAVLQTSMSYLTMLTSMQ